jgi:tellurite resistance protein TerC
MQSSLMVILLLGVIVLSLILDLGLFSSNHKANLSFKQSALRSALWFSLGLASVVVMYFGIPYLHNIENLLDLKSYQDTYGITFHLNEDFNASLRSFKNASMWLYLSGFLLEYALSIDNLFVMLLVFKSFKLNEAHERKVLVWGILGAMVLRFIFIYLGSAAIQKFHWVLYVFGAILIISGLKLAIEKETETQEDATEHIIMRFFKRFFKVADGENARGHFFVKTNGAWHVTVLFVVLVIIEMTDVVFAIDSVPAVFGVTRDPFLVFFSNIFAILGLRSLYFLVGHGISAFWALKYGLSVILVFIGVKMLLETQFHAIGFNHMHNLLVIVGVMALSIGYSLWKPQHA